MLLSADGKTTLHALGSLEARGSLFAGPATEVYSGMIIGECSRGNDLEVNPVREKKLSNVRAAGADEKACCTLHPNNANAYTHGMLSVLNVFLLVFTCRVWVQLMLGTKARLNKGSSHMEWQMRGIQRNARLLGIWRIN